MIPHTDPRVTSFSTLSGPTAACSTLSGPAVVCVSNLQPCPGRPPPAQSCPGQRPATGRSLFKFVQTGRRLLNLVLTGGPRLLTNVRVGRRLLSQEHTAGCTYYWMQHCFLVHSFILSSSNVKSMTEACGGYCHPHCSASKRKRELFCKNRMSRKSPILHVAPMWTHSTPPIAQKINITVIQHVITICIHPGGFYQPENVFAPRCTTASSTVQYQHTELVQKPL